MSNKRPLSPVVSLPGSANKRPPQQQAADATPSTSSSANSDLSTLQGALISLTLVDSITHQGLLWAYDPLLQAIVLQSNSNTAKKDYKIIKTQSITSIQVISLPTEQSIKALAAATPLANVSIDKVKMNLSKGLEADQLREKRLGKGVSRLGQEIFDALSKTLKTDWQDSNILVLDDVLIKEPYMAQDCSSTTAAKAKLDRVIKVLSGERERILRANPDLEKGG